MFFKAIFGWHRNCLLISVMGRPPRVQDSELHFHVITRCNNNAFSFESDEDFATYLDILRFFKQKHHFTLFNYELMNSHVHLLLQPSPHVSLHKTMLLINWSFARDYNSRKNRKGHFWLNRYKSIPVETDRYALDLMRYINRNPVRAGMVQNPGDWKWSGYRFYAYGEPNTLLEYHPAYLGLSLQPQIRQQAFVDYVCMVLPEGNTRRPEWSDAPFIGSELFGRQLGLSSG